MLRALLTRITERGRVFARGVGSVARFFLALNAFCWLLFLTREPVNADDYAMSRILPGGGIEFTGSTATPHVVASRTVARGGWHGVGTRPVETYRLLNQPALLLGLLLYPIGWIGFTFGINAVRIISLSPASPLTANPESWILAGSLLLATSLQWGLIGRFFDRRLATRSVRISEARGASRLTAISGVGPVGLRCVG